MVFLAIFTGVSLILIKKTTIYVSLLAWFVAVVQLCELPVCAVFPTWYLVMTAAWIFASFFFLTVLTFQTLFQALPILLVLFIGLPIRLVWLIDAW